MEENMTFEELQQMVSVCIDELLLLKEEKEQTERRNAELENAMRQMLDSQKLMGEKIVQCFDHINKIYHKFEICQEIMTRLPDNIRYELQDEEQTEDLYQLRFYDHDETIRGICGGKSLARFGDGEFALMAGYERQKFQRYDERLARRLREIICTDEDGMMIAVADNYGSLEKYNAAGKMGIRMYMTKEVRLQHRAWLNPERRYHDTYISRPYVIYADNMTDAPRKRFQKLREIWEGKDIIFVEGALTRLGVGNDLFANAKRIRRIEAPATSSFDRYDDILSAALKYRDEDVLFLASLGPAACVLCYDLYKAGCQAVDIGHVDLEYEWYLNGTGGRCEVKHKYNNEVSGGDQVDEPEDAAYLEQVIEKIY